MSSRTSPFEIRLRLLLVLLAMVLAAANVANFLLLRTARDGLRQAEGRLASEISGRILKEAGEGAIARAFSDGQSLPVLYPPTRLRSLARRADILVLDLVGLDGRVLSSSSPQRLGEADPDLPGPASLERRSLEEGRAYWLGPVAAGEQGALVHYLPVLGEPRRTTGFMKTTLASSTLATVENAYKVFAAAQAIGLVLAVVAALLISRWIARPYRLLAQAVVGAPEGVGPPAAEADDPDALVTIFRRVMEKIRTQEEELRRLAATEGEDPVGRFASTIAPTMVSGVIAVDRKGLVVALNPAAERMLGTPERSGEGGEARTGRAYAQVLACSEELVRIIGESLASGKPRSREVVSYRTSRGEPGHLGVALSPIAAEGAWPGGLLCLISDLSEIGSLQDKTRLRENLAAVGRLSAGIAHEFRNSLATIHGYARLVERLGEGGPTSGHARAIVREVDSVRAAVDEFLAFTRPAKITRTRVDLSSLCRQVAEEIALDGGLRPLEVTFEGTLPVVVGDETLLRQAFANIFRNAAESAPGRAVRLRVRGEMGPRSEAVRVELADDGAGIRQEDLERVFLPFYTTKEKGSGLGLAMAQKTILDHDGSVEVRSKLGEGTTFTVVLPIGVDAPA